MTEEQIKEWAEHECADISTQTWGCAFSGKQAHAERRELAQAYVEQEGLLKKVRQHLAATERERDEAEAVRDALAGEAKQQRANTDEWRNRFELCMQERNAAALARKI